MGKKNGVTVEGNTISGTAESITNALKKATEKLTEKDSGIVITNAVIKEMLCNYGYEITSGPCSGDKIPTRKGSGIVHEDMITAFNSLRIHLAVLDDAFKDTFPELPKEMAALDQFDIDDFKIVGFKITGGDENESFVLIGDKWVTYGAIGFETPKISQSTGYPYFEELKSAIDTAKKEVEKYMNGKIASDNQPELPFPANGSAQDNGDFENPID